MPSCRPSQRRQDHTAHSFFFELVGELVQVRDPLEYESFLGFVNGLDTDRLAPVATASAPEASFVGQCVYQPRLAAGEFPDALFGTGLEGLVALGSVLGEQFPNFGFRKVAEAQRHSFDVERTASSDVRRFAAGIDLVVAHIPDSAQDDSLREVVRATVVVHSQLPQDGDECIPSEGVNLVD